MRGIPCLHSVPVWLSWFLLAAMVPLAAALVVAAAPGVAHAETATQVAIVQGTLPIGSDEEFDKSRQSSGHIARQSARAFSAAGALDAADEGALECGTPFADLVPESLSLNPANAPALAQGDGGYGQSEANSQVGDACTFFAKGRAREGFTARVVAVGEMYTIWVEEGYNLFTSSDLKVFAKELDTAMAAVYEAFGTTGNVDVDGDGKVAFVFHRFGGGEDYAGYFWSGDLFSKEELEQGGFEEYAPYANHRDMLHININTMEQSDGSFDKNQVMLTLVHELQHLVNFAQTDGKRNAWLDESFSQAAVAIAGYGKGEAERLNNLWMVMYYGAGVPFVFEGNYIPGDSRGEESSLAYAQWYLFSRYLANQTEGLASEDGALRGGDDLYKSVLDCERDENGFGSCTKDALVKTLEAIGYLGEGRKALDFDDLLFNYNTALLVRDATGPCSLTNDPTVSPSVIDGARFDLLEVMDRFVPEAVFGGGAAVYVELDRARPTAGGPGEGVQERVVDAPLPLCSVAKAFPASGAMMRDGDPIVLESPQLGGVEGMRLEYCAMLQWEPEIGMDKWVYEEYDGPIAFNADAPLLAVRLACDRGAFFPKYFYYEIDASGPGEPEEPESPKEPDLIPGKSEGPEESSAPPPPGDVDDGGDAHLAAVLAPTGDPLAPVTAELAALMVVGSATALAAKRRGRG